jgi:hypothetical protein
MNQLIVSPASALLPAQLFAPTPKAAKRVLEFFTAQINNDHTRRAYLAATRHFADWCGLHGIQQLEDVQPFHVAAFVKDMEGHVATPTVKQHRPWKPASCLTASRSSRRPKTRRALKRRTGLNRLARSRTHRRDDLHLCPRERGHQYEGERFLHARKARLGPPPRERRQRARSALPPHA